MAYKAHILYLNIYRYIRSNPFHFQSLCQGCDAPVLLLHLQMRALILFVFWFYFHWFGILWSLSSITKNLKRIKYELSTFHSIGSAIDVGIWHVEN